MSFLDKIKKIFRKKESNDVNGNSHSRRKFILTTLFLLVNVTAVAVATFAWFAIPNAESNIEMVSGDLNVKIRKLSAYKYVYPYYSGSTDFINYEGDGTIKQYVLEDHTLMYGSSSIDDLTINVNNTTSISLSNTVNHVYSNAVDPVPAVSENDDPTPLDYSGFSETYINCPAGTNFRYFIIGDNTFCGDNRGWSTNSAIAFANQDDITAEHNVTISNVVISAGSKFILFDKATISGATADYFTYSTAINSTNGQFKVLGGETSGTCIMCLKSGVYSFTYSLNTLTIELQNRRNAVVCNNPLDPTLVSIEYAGGGVDHSTYQEMKDYLPQAIYNQNTMVILDVELDLRNVNKIRVGLQVERNVTPYPRCIFNLEDKYDDTLNNLRGYLPNDASEETYSLYASDFYSFYAWFTNNAFASLDAAWGTELNPSLHRRTDYEIDDVPQFTKFVNSDIDDDGEEDYSSVVECPLHTDGDIVIPPCNDEDDDYDFYHCYICIDYDYEYSNYFMNENRLGKTYLLFRDFGFRFTGTQVLES